MREGTGWKYQRELSKELVELLERFSQTVSISSASEVFLGGLRLKERIFEGCWLCVSYCSFLTPLCVSWIPVQGKKPTVALSVAAAFQQGPYTASNETRLLVLTCLLTQYGMVYSAAKWEAVRIHWFLGWEIPQQPSPWKTRHTALNPSESGSSWQGQTVVILTDTSSKSTSRWSHGRWWRSARPGCGRAWMPHPQRTEKGGFFVWSWSRVSLSQL